MLQLSKRQGTGDEDEKSERKVLREKEERSVALLTMNFSKNPVWVLAETFSNCNKLVIYNSPELSVDVR
jgi:hypothetical protein